MGAMAPRTLLAAVLLLVACTAPAVPGRSAQPTASASPTRTSAATPVPASAISAHVFVIVMENRTYAEAMAQPYTSSLAAQYAVATNYHAITHPSLPNYLALTGGSTFGVKDNDYHRLPPGGIGAQLSERGIPWRAYMEGMSGDCLVSQGRYAVKHNPFAYFGGACPNNVVPLTPATLDADLSGATPNFVWITPDLCHDGHDCSTRVADDYLADLVPKIIASAAWQKDGLLLITWDEDDGSTDNRVPAIVVARGLTQHETSRPHDHYSLLAMIEDRLGLPRLGQARGAEPLTELFS